MEPGMVITSGVRRAAPYRSLTALRLAASILCLAMPLAGRMAYAQTVKSEYPESKIILYNFQNTGKAAEFGYYSYIIPDSISTELKRSKKYDIRSFPVTIEYVDSKAPEDVRANAVRLLAERGKEFGADFVITGSYQVENRRISIKTQVFDVHNGKIRDISETSEELGAMLLIIIDSLTEKIDTELQKGAADRLAAKAASPYIPFYRALCGWSLGATIGTVQMLGPWGDIYEDRYKSASLYVRYDPAESGLAKGTPILRNMAFSLQYDYLTADNSEKDEPAQSIFTMRSFSLSGLYLYRIESFFALAAGAGAGLAVSLVEIPGPDIGGPSEILDSRRTYDPSIQLSAGALFLFSRVELGAGIEWHHIFFKDRGMDFTRLYFSLGYRL